ncbi:MAG: hypothetical protein ACLR6J_00905 [Parabacteroides merdae]
MRRMKARLARYRASCRTMCRTIRLRTALALYLAALGIMALWADRSEVVLGCIGALLTLSEYGTNGTGQASSFVGWALIAYATGMSLWGALNGC